MGVSAALERAPAPRAERRLAPRAPLSPSDDGDDGDGSAPSRAAAVAERARSDRLADEVLSAKLKQLHASFREAAPSRVAANGAG